MRAVCTRHVRCGLPTTHLAVSAPCWWCGQGSVFVSCRVETKGEDSEVAPLRAIAIVGGRGGVMGYRTVSLRFWEEVLSTTC